MGDEEHREQQGERPPAEPEQETPQQAAAEDIGGKALADALKVSFRFLKFAMIVLVGIYLLSGIFYVKPHEVKVKLRFGRPVKVGGRYVMDSESGWHIRWPWEQVISIPVTEQVIDLNREFWFYEPRIGEPPPPMGSLNVKRDGYLLTGDINIVHMKLRVRYQARADEQGALDYLFHVEDPEALLKRFVVKETIKMVGREQVDDVRAEKKQTVKNSIVAEVKKKLNEFEKQNGFTAGVRLVSIDYAVDPAVPLAVRDAFYEAQQASEEKSERIRQAREEEKRIEQHALEVKARVLNEAQGYKRRMEVLAKADATALSRLLTAYEASPAMAAILRERHYQRMAEKLLGGAKDVFVLHGADEGSRREIRILLSRQPRKAKLPKAPQQGSSSGR